MRCVVLQPSYIPWRGYFDQIARADVFVFYDCVQYDRRGWRNRNRIKTPNGTQWLTIPVNSKDVQKVGTPIKDIVIDWDRPWNKKHRQTLQTVYGKAPYFGRYADSLDDYFGRRPTWLADFTIDLTVRLAELLGIRGTTFLRSSELPAHGSKTERLLSILEHLGATHYISGPSARDYIDEVQFKSAGITVEFMDYNYPEYPQLYPPFDPFVSILDLLFMTGDSAGKYLLAPRKQ